MAAWGQAIAASNSARGVRSKTEAGQREIGEGVKVAALWRPLRVLLGVCNWLQQEG